MFFPIDGGAQGEARRHDSELFSRYECSGSQWQQPGILQEKRCSKLVKNSHKIMFDFKTNYNTFSFFGKGSLTRFYLNEIIFNFAESACELQDGTPSHL